MVGRWFLLGSVCIVTLGLVITGCAQTRPSGTGLFGRRTKTTGDGPPVPAPALYIPGPAAQAPAVETTADPTPIPSQSPIQPAAYTETLPLQAPRPFDSTGSGVAALPPLVAPARAAEPANGLAPFHELYQKAAQTYASMDSYTVRLRRREVVGNQNRPEEILLFKWRREPWSVYFKWLGAEGKGREVIYVRGRYEGALHTLTAAGDLPLLPAGRHIKVSPDGVLVKSKSRYPITQAGLGVLVERFGKIVENQDKGDLHEGSLKYLGQLKRPEYEHNVEGVLQIVPAKGDPNLPRGGQRHWFFDPESHLPMLLITQDETGREVEYYCHDRLMFPIHLTDDDFNPDLLWKTAAKN
jgi:hypothetical protein